jgi:hypothetical protein
VFQDYLEQSPEQIENRKHGKSNKNICYPLRRLQTESLRMKDLGTVYLYVDYTVPVHELREELHRILRESSWDGNIWRLQVTDATERTVQLRALMSAPDAGSAWNLRCEVREKLIEFLQKKYPGVLPKFRAEFNAPGHPVESV